MLEKCRSRSETNAIHMGGSFYWCYEIIYGVMTEGTLEVQHRF